MHENLALGFGVVLGVSIIVNGLLAAYVLYSRRCCRSWCVRGTLHVARAARGSLRAPGRAGLLLRVASQRSPPRRARAAASTAPRTRRASRARRCAASAAGASGTCASCGPGWCARGSEPRAAPPPCSLPRRHARAAPAADDARRAAQDCEWKIAPDTRTVVARPAVAVFGFPVGAGFLYSASVAPQPQPQPRASEAPPQQQQPAAAARVELSDVEDGDGGSAGGLSYDLEAAASGAGDAPSAPSTAHNPLFVAGA
jgi:hypothetical protein